MTQQRYFLELIEHKHQTNSGLPSLSITSHYEVLKMLPFNEYDFSIIEDTKYKIGKDESI